MKTVKVVAGIGKAEISDAETGAPIHGISAVDVVLRPNDVPRLTLQVVGADVSAEGVAEFVAADPRTGDLKPIAKIVFADGTEFVPG